jgi:uncharacterized protein YbjT (DUF2867 family)
VLEKLGGQVARGDLLEIDTVRAAMKGADAAYFVWPIAPGLVHAGVNFAQAAREAEFQPSSIYRSAPPIASPRATRVGTASSPSRC